jgi:uncharacterized membrane protein
MEPEKKHTAVTTPGMSHVIERNINVLMKRNAEEDKKKTREEKIADAITRFTGSMLFVYIHLALFAFWILWNSGLFNVPSFDKSYVILAMFASVEAIFLSTFVLISQNRMNLQADKRADLDLQISLLTEHELTRLINIVDAMSKKMNITIDEDVMDEISKDVHPEKVMDAMDEFKKNSNKKNS